MKKILSLFLIIILIIQLCCIATVFANAVTDGFDDAASWSVNIPEIYQNGGESYAHLKHTSALKAFTQYKFTPPANDIDGKFVVEMKVKNPSASMSLITVYLKNMSTSAVQMRSQYTSLNDGYSWRNLKTDKPISRIKTDAIAEKPDFSYGWDTIYMAFDTAGGVVDVYFNGSGVKYTGETDQNAGGLNYITFSVRKDMATEADAGMFIDYVSVYPYEDTFTPPECVKSTKFTDEDFEKYEPGDNAFKGFIGYGPSTADYYAMVEYDPENSENKCIKLENTSASTKNIAADLGCENLHFEFKAYMPDNVYAQFPKFRSGSKDVIYGSVDVNGKYNISGGGSVEFDRNGWNSFEFDFDGKNAYININDNDTIVVACDAQKIDCALFGLWDNMAPIYIDDILIYENNGQPVIRASKKSGTVKYGDKIYLESNNSGAEIYYTLDGSDPDTSSFLYTEDGIAITDNDVVIKAYGVNGDIAGRIFTFGKYSLESEDGIIFIPVNFEDNASSLDADFSFINTQSDTKNICIILGMYDKDGVLIDSVYEENFSLESGRNSKTLSLSYPKGANSGDITFKAYIWSDMESYAPKTAAAVFKNGSVSYEDAPICEYGEYPSMPSVGQYKINNEEKTVTLIGSMENTVKNQDITFAVFDKNQRLIVLEQTYVNAEKEFIINAKFDASKTSGGALGAYVGSRQNTSAVFLDNGYYVDDLENASLTLLLNSEETSASLIERMKNYSSLNIIPIDFENNAEYLKNKDIAERILFCSRNEEKFKSLSGAAKAFEKACASANVINGADKKYYENILNGISALDYALEENYKISDIENFDIYNQAFGYLLSKEDLLLLTNRKIEKLYKISYALCTLNTAQRSEVTGIIEKYNNEIFNLDMSGDYKEVSAYEVAKALYDKNFKTAKEVKTAFDNRVEYLINNPPSQGGSSSGGSSSGGSSNRVTVNTPVNIVPDTAGDIKPIFNDVNKDHWAFEYVEKLCGEKIISGYGDNTFNPDGSVTRAELLKMTVSAFNLNSTDGKADFKDVSESDWFAPFIAAAAKSGLALGFDGYIKPYDSITREDAALIIARAKGYEMPDVSKTSFADDNNISDYAKSAVEYLAKTGIINGYDGNMFMPLKSITRAEAAKILCSALGL